MGRRMLSVTVVMILASLPAAFAQGPNERDAVIQALASQDLPTRQMAAAQLRRLIEATPSLAAEPDIRRAVLERTNTDTAYIKEAYRRGIALDEGFGEAYSEGPLMLLLLVARETPIQEITPVVDAMASSVFTEGSEFAKELATYGEMALPTLRLQTQSAMSPERHRSLWVIGCLLEKDATGQLQASLSRESRRAAKEALRSALTAPKVADRLVAIEAVEVSGDADFIPALEAMAVNAKAAQRATGTSSSLDKYVQRALNRLKTQPAPNVR